MPPQPLLGVGPDGRSWPREGRGSTVGAVVVIVLVSTVLAIGAAILEAPLATLGLGVFAAYTLLTFLASLPAALTPWIVQVGPDGIWLPELGYRRWTDFSSVRVETYASPRDGVGPNCRPRPRRRLGLRAPRRCGAGHEPRGGAGGRHPPRLVPHRVVGRWGGRSAGPRATRSVRRTSARRRSTPSWPRLPKRSRSSRTSPWRGRNRTPRGLARGRQGSTEAVGRLGCLRPVRAVHPGDGRVREARRGRRPRRSDARARRQSIR